MRTASSVVCMFGRIYMDNGSWFDQLLGWAAQLPGVRFAYRAVVQPVHSWIVEPTIDLLSQSSLLLRLSLYNRLAESFPQLQQVLLNRTVLQFPQTSARKQDWGKQQ